MTVRNAAFRAFLKAGFVRIPLGSVSDRQGKRKGHFYDLTEALAAVAQDQTPATANTKAWGCSVKYAR